MSIALCNSLLSLSCARSLLVVEGQTPLREGTTPASICKEHHSSESRQLQHRHPCCSSLDGPRAPDKSRPGAPPPRCRPLQYGVEENFLWCVRYHLHSTVVDTMAQCHFPFSLYYTAAPPLSEPHFLTWAPCLAASSLCRHCSSYLLLLYELFASSRSIFPFLPALCPPFSALIPLLHHLSPALTAPACKCQPESVCCCCWICACSFHLDEHSLFAHKQFRLSVNQYPERFLF